MAERNANYSKYLAFPYLGENSRDPLLAMADKYAVSMNNFFPKGTYGELRRGYRSHSTSLGTGAVETIAAYYSAGGTEKLIGCANNSIYDATTFGAAATSKASGFTSNRWQTVNYLDKLILVNGVDQPQQYDGSTVSNAAYTGIADDNKLVDVCVYKERLFFVEKDSASIWYLPVGTVTGALTQFPVKDFMRGGGYIQAISTWTANTGAGLSDLLVVITSEGEILTYTGTDPATDFSLDGRYMIPKPHGRRCKRNIGADLFILHQQGITSLGQLISGVDVATGFTQFTNAIAPTFTSASDLYGSNTGWDIFFYPRGQWALINVPIASNSVSKQFILNTETKAWCQFTGINSLCWCLFQEKAYFGGADGTIYQADITGSDNGSAINASVKFAFNFFNDSSSTKLFHMARADIAGSNDANLLFAMDVDGQSTMSTDSIDITEQEGSEWDTSPWDSTPWGQESFYSTNIEGLQAEGKAGALKISGKFRNVAIKIMGAQVYFEKGGYI